MCRRHCSETASFALARKKQGSEWTELRVQTVSNWRRSVRQACTSRIHKRKDRDNHPGCSRPTMRLPRNLLGKGSSYRAPDGHDHSEIRGSCRSRSLPDPAIHRCCSHPKQQPSREYGGRESPALSRNRHPPNSDTALTARAARQAHPTGLLRSRRTDRLIRHCRSRPKLRQNPCPPAIATSEHLEIGETRQVPPTELHR